MSVEIEIEASVEIVLKCDRCGRSLVGKSCFMGTIDVEPCDNCMEEAQRAALPAGATRETRQIDAPTEPVAEVVDDDPARDDDGYEQWRAQADRDLGGGE